YRRCPLLRDGAEVFLEKFGCCVPWRSDFARRLKVGQKFRNAKSKDAKKERIPMARPLSDGPVGDLFPPVGNQEPKGANRWIAAFVSFTAKRCPQPVIDFPGNVAAPSLGGGLAQLL